MILQNQAITKKSAFFFRASRITQQNPDFFSGQGEIFQGTVENAAFSRPGRTYEGYGLARRDGQVHVVEDFGRVGAVA